MLFYTLYYGIISLANLKITQAFHLLLGLAETSIVSRYFKIQNSVQITGGLDNGDSDNRGSTVLTIFIHIKADLIYMQELKYTTGSAAEKMK